MQKLAASEQKPKLQNKVTCAAAHFHFLVIRGQGRQQLSCSTTSPEETTHSWFVKNTGCGWFFFLLWYQLCVSFACQASGTAAVQTQKHNSHQAWLCHHRLCKPSVASQHSTDSAFCYPPAEGHYLCMPTPAQLQKNSCLRTSFQ